MGAAMPRSGAACRQNSYLIAHCGYATGDEAGGLVFGSGSGLQSTWQAADAGSLSTHKARRRARARAHRFVRSRIVRPSGAVSSAARAPALQAGVGG